MLAAHCPSLLIILGTVGAHSRAAILTDKYKGPPLSRRGPSARDSVFSFGRAKIGLDTVNVELTAFDSRSALGLNRGGTTALHKPD
jgi:hypothetical protein